MPQSRSQRRSEPRSPHRSERLRRGALRVAAACVAVAALAGAAASARAEDRLDEYDPQRAGHPLRIVAYIVHPVGVAIDYLLMRPAYWVVCHEPFATIFGHTEDD
jgi:hypothetical protein